MVTFNYGFYTGKPKLQLEKKLMKDIFSRFLCAAKLRPKIL